MLGLLSLAVTVLFILAIVISTVINAGKLEINLPEGESSQYFKPSNNNVTVHTDPENERRLIVRANDGKRGDTFLDNRAPEGKVSFEYIRVLPGGMIYNPLNGNFSGYKSFIVITAVYFTIITALTLVSFIVRCRTQLFSYTTLFFAGSSLFLLGIVFDLMVSIITMMKNPMLYHMGYFYSTLTGSSSGFMFYTAPIMLIFAIALAVSNISLIKHEGMYFVNILGIILSAMIIISYAVLVFMLTRPMIGSEMEVRIKTALNSIFPTIFVYFEAMLLAAVICGAISAKRRPKYDKTHIIILGCKIGDDGTPLPLLKGRIDCAIEFAKTQKEAGGGDVCFVPSGGQGSDEVMSEAESMRDYLVSNGVAEDRIIVENKSTNTDENMRFSKEKIYEDCDSPNIIFSTSNYHILRSGMISRRAGLDAEGIGCKTKWYFWPNAYVREFIGLLASKWRRHLEWVIFFTIIFVVINMIVPM